MSTLTAEHILAVTDPKLLWGEDSTTRFRELAKEWHPDMCKDPNATKVMDHLMRLREAAKRGLKLEGAKEETVIIPGGTVHFSLDAITLCSKVPTFEQAKLWIDNLRKLSPDLARRIPEPLLLSPEGTVLTLKRPPDTVSMTTVMHKYPEGVPQRHVAWIVSRLLELVMETHKIGRCVCGGLLPESMAVIVDSHGVIPLDWRFTIGNDSKLSRLPEALLSHVPKDKKARVIIDLAAVNRMAMVLLGDSSGSGNVLLLRAKKDPENMAPGFLDWFRGPVSDDPVKHYENYRAMLMEVFGKPKYYKLEL